MKRQFSQEEWEIIYNSYVNDKKGLAYTAKLVGSSANTIKNLLKEHGISIRSQHEAAILSNKNRATKKDETYFQNQSHNMAWILGFIAADGTIRKNSNEIKIGLAIKDKEILEKIREELKIPAIVKEYTNTQGYDCCTLAWTCEQHKKDLALYHLIPAKTFQLKPPSDVLKREYWIDYIRGYFDGDGSVNLLKNSNGRGNGNLRWQVCSATKEILDWIVDFFYEEYGIKKVNILCDTTRQQPLYYFQYSSVATRQIYKILYTSDSLFLKRKKDHFDEIMTIVTPLN